MKLDLHNKLSLNNWEKALRQFPFIARGGWSKKIEEGGLIINLSKVGWVEPVAALRVVLFIEAALLDGVKVTVRLPFPEATHSEQNIFDLASNSKDPSLQKKAKNTGINIRRRRAASLALRDLRFKEALLHPHLQLSPDTLKIVEKYDWSVPDEIAESTQSETETEVKGILDGDVLPWSFEVVYGLQWIPDPRSEEGRRIIDHLADIDVLADILSHPTQRVSAADGATLAHVFLKELVENTIDHSGREFALIAALRRQRGYNLKEDEVYNCEKGFAIWCKNYLLTEVMVGDSGDGIPSSLAKEYRRKKPSSPERLIEATVNTRILAWAFDKWSSRSSSDSKRGTRGLYRAERIVRKYDGCITLRSESSYVGIECGSNDPPDFIYEQGLARSPGTVVHVRLPVIPSEKIPPRQSNPALHRASIEVVDFYGLDWSRKGETIDLICEQIRRRCEGKSPSRQPHCLIADFGYAKIERRALEDLLIRLVEIAHPVALVVANVKAPSRDSAAETIHSIAEQIAPEKGSNEASAELPEALHVRDAILFQYTDGSFAWVGEPPHITEHLNRLWENETITSAELANEIPDEIERNELIRQFAEAYHVAHRLDDGGISLNFNKEDIQEKLQRHIADLLRKKIEEGSSRAIRMGKFRTPSLEIVSKYTRVKVLLEEIGLDRATAVLAKKCAGIEALQQAKSLQLIADWKSSRDVLESFRDNLCEALQFPKGNFILHQINAGDPPDIREDSEIIIYTDIILAGDLVSSLISQIVRARKKPTLIATIFDARQEEARGKLLTASGLSTKMISITNVDIWVKDPDDSSEPININPTTHEPEIDDDRGDPDYPITSELLTEMIKQEDALYFDHIVRPSGRHFCFYLDPFKLLGALDTDDPFDLSENGSNVISKFEEEINDWLSPEGKLDIIYFPNLPRSERPSPTKLLIGRKLAEKYGTRLVPVSSLTGISFSKPEIPIKRLAFQYRAPSESLDSEQPFLFDLPPQRSDLESSKSDSRTQTARAPQRALIIDWGSVTGTAIRASIRYAAAKGADQILALSLLSQLPVDEEKFLTSLTQIETLKNKDGEILIRNCEVRVKFLARYPIQVYEPRLCPYCRQLGRLEEEERFYPSKLLADFIKEAKARLGQRYIEGEEGIRAEHHRKKLSPSVDEDYLSDVIDPDRNVTELANLRNQLAMAKMWTKVRWELYQDLTSLEFPLPNDSYELRLRRACLIKLLAVEWLWLKQEPLSMIKFRRQIAKLAINAIKDTECFARERLDAIVVLRTASKEAFAQNVPSIFKAIIQDGKLSEDQSLSLISQLLYGAFTYLQRGYLMSGTLRPLVEALTECASLVPGLLGQPNRTIALRVGRTINSLQQYGRFLLHSLTPITAPDAWRILKDQLGPKYHIHHPVCVAFDSLRFGPLEKDIENPLVEAPHINWSTKRKSWEQKCVPFIIDTILPLLTPLREVFEGLDAKIMVGENRAETLALVERKFFNDLATLSHLLAVFASSPTAMQQPGVWKNFVQARDSIWHLLIDPGKILQDNFREGGSSLIRLVQDCPADLLSITKEFTDADLFDGKLEIRLENELSSNSASVFCHTDVLRESITELLRNVNRHVRNLAVEHSKSALKNTDSGGNAIPVEIHLSGDDQYLCLLMRNGGNPIESQAHGRGLEMCAERLSPYGATVKQEDSLPPPWVFGVELTFLRG
ncbi:MAG: hypothetical protein QOC96_1074 [Acidobacteriota bacterium]|jgi:hypothetical protein|nr:hypothetical protein [Acidobacteriota bacterium]